MDIHAECHLSRYRSEIEQITGRFDKDQRYEFKVLSQIQESRILVADVRRQMEENSNNNWTFSQPKSTYYHADDKWMPHATPTINIPHYVQTGDIATQTEPVRTKPLKVRTQSIQTEPLNVETQRIKAKSLGVKVQSMQTEPSDMRAKSMQTEPFDVMVKSMQTEPMDVNVQSIQTEPMGVKVQSMQTDTPGLKVQSLQTEPMGVMVHSVQTEPLGVKVQSIQTEPMGVMGHSVQTEPLGVKAQSIQTEPMGVKAQSLQTEPFNVKVQSVQTEHFGVMNQGVQTEPLEVIPIDVMVQGVQTEPNEIRPLDVKVQNIQTDPNQASTLDVNRLKTLMIESVRKIKSTSVRGVSDFLYTCLAEIDSIVSENRLSKKDVRCCLNNQGLFEDLVETTYVLFPVLEMCKQRINAENLKRRKVRITAKRFSSSKHVLHSDVRPSTIDQSKLNTMTQDNGAERTALSEGTYSSSSFSSDDVNFVAPSLKEIEYESNTSDIADEIVHDIIHVIDESSSTELADHTKQTGVEETNVEIKDDISLHDVKENEFRNVDTKEASQHSDTPFQISSNTYPQTSLRNMSNAGISALSDQEETSDEIPEDIISCQSETKDNISESDDSFWNIETGNENPNKAIHTVDCTKDVQLSLSSICTDPKEKKSVSQTELEMPEDKNLPNDENNLQHTSPMQKRANTFETGEGDVPNTGKAALSDGEEANDEIPEDIISCQSETETRSESDDDFWDIKAGQEKQDKAIYTEYCTWDVQQSAAINSTDVLETETVSTTRLKCPDVRSLPADENTTPANLPIKSKENAFENVKTQTSERNASNEVNSALPEDEKTDDEIPEDIISCQSETSDKSSESDGAFCDIKTGNDNQNKAVNMYNVECTRDVQLSSSSTKTVATDIKYVSRTDLQADLQFPNVKSFPDENPKQNQNPKEKLSNEVKNLECESISESFSSASNTSVLSTQTSSDETSDYSDDSLSTDENTRKDSKRKSDFSDGSVSFDKKTEESLSDESSTGKSSNERSAARRSNHGDKADNNRQTDGEMPENILSYKCKTDDKNSDEDDDFWNMDFGKSTGNPEKAMPSANDTKDINISPKMTFQVDGKTKKVQEVKRAVDDSVHKSSSDDRNADEGHRNGSNAEKNMETDEEIPEEIMSFQCETDSNVSGENDDFWNINIGKSTGNQEKAMHSANDTKDVQFSPKNACQDGGESKIIQEVKSADDDSIGKSTERSSSDEESAAISSDHEKNNGKSAYHGINAEKDSETGDEIPEDIPSYKCETEDNNCSVADDDFWDMDIGINKGNHNNVMSTSPVARNVHLSLENTWQVEVKSEMMQEAKSVYDGKSSLPVPPQQSKQTVVKDVEILCGGENTDKPKVTHTLNCFALKTDVTKDIDSGNKVVSEGEKSSVFVTETDEKKIDRDSTKKIKVNTVRILKEECDKVILAMIEEMTLNESKKKAQDVANNALEMVSKYNLEYGRKSIPAESTEQNVMKSFDEISGPRTENGVKDGQNETKYKLEPGSSVSIADIEEQTNNEIHKGINSCQSETKDNSLDDDDDFWDIKAGTENRNKPINTEDCTGGVHLSSSSLHVDTKKKEFTSRTDFSSELKSQELERDFENSYSLSHTSDFSSPITSSFKISVASSDTDSSSESFSSYESSTSTENSLSNDYSTGKSFSDDRGARKSSNRMRTLKKKSDTRSDYSDDSYSTDGCSSGVGSYNNKTTINSFSDRKSTRKGFSDDESSSSEYSSDESSDGKSSSDERSAGHESCKTNDKTSQEVLSINKEIGDNCPDEDVDMDVGISTENQVKTLFTNKGQVVATNCSNGNGKSEEMEEVLNTTDHGSSLPLPLYKATSNSFVEMLNDIKDAKKLKINVVKEECDKILSAIIEQIMQAKSKNMSQNKETGVLELQDIELVRDIEKIPKYGRRSKSLGSDQGNMINLVFGQNFSDFKDASGTFDCGNRPKTNTFSTKGSDSSLRKAVNHTNCNPEDDFLQAFVDEKTDKRRASCGEVTNIEIQDKSQANQIQVTVSCESLETFSSEESSIKSCEQKIYIDTDEKENSKMVDKSKEVTSKPNPWSKTKPNPWSKTKPNPWSKTKPNPWSKTLANYKTVNDQIRSGVKQWVTSKHSATSLDEKAKGDNKDKDKKKKRQPFKGYAIDDSYYTDSSSSESEKVPFPDFSTVTLPGDDGDDEIDKFLNEIGSRRSVKPKKPCIKEKKKKRVRFAEENEVFEIEPYYYSDSEEDAYSDDFEYEDDFDYDEYAQTLDKEFCGDDDVNEESSASDEPSHYSNDCSYDTKPNCSENSGRGSFSSHSDVRDKDDKGKDMQSEKSDSSSAYSCGDKIVNDQNSDESDDVKTESIEEQLSVENKSSSGSDTSNSCEKNLDQVFGIRTTDNEVFENSDNAIQKFISEGARAYKQKSDKNGEDKSEKENLSKNDNEEEVSIMVQKDKIEIIKDINDLSEIHESELNRTLSGNKCEIDNVNTNGSSNPSLGSSVDLLLGNPLERRGRSSLLAPLEQVEKGSSKKKQKKVKSKHAHDDGEKNDKNTKTKRKKKKLCEKKEVKPEINAVKRVAKVKKRRVRHDSDSSLDGFEMPEFELAEDYVLECQSITEIEEKKSLSLQEEIFTSEHTS